MNEIKKVTTVERPCFGGGKSIHTLTESNIYRGEILGASLAGTEEIFEESTDHIESEDATTMTFDFGTVKKAFIKSLVWTDSGMAGCGRVVAFVRVAAH